jgi:signal peptidase II
MKKYFYSIIFVVLLAIDQIFKAIIVNTNPNIDLKLLAIRFVQNTGATFGILQNFNSLFIWISLIAIGLLMMNYDHFPKKSNFFLMIIIVGIIGNLIDRIFRSYVVDFIDFKIWPVFNFADMFITVGVIGVIYYLWSEK